MDRLRNLGSSVRSRLSWKMIFIFATIILLIIAIMYVYKRYMTPQLETDYSPNKEFIDEVEPGSLRLPVLIKKYIKQNAKVVAFNVDPLFNNAVDGLMYIRIADLPESTVKPVMDEFQAEWEKKINSKV